MARAADMTAPAQHGNLVGGYVETGPAATAFLPPGMSSLSGADGAVPPINNASTARQEKKGAGWSG
jgi:hypothetical protein